MYQKMQKNVENGPQMGTHVRTIFCHPASFLLSQAPLGANMAPKAPPGPVQASISTDFETILDDCLMIFHITWATFGPPKIDFHLLPLAPQNRF